MDENVALEKKSQNKFVKKIKRVKEQVQVAEIDSQEENAPAKRTWKPRRGLVYVGHLPHGFYEKEMSAYFKQFGKISSLRICRSSKTGRSKGYAFIEFENADVAKIAAETMDNYLMFNRRLEAKFIKSNQSRKLRKFKSETWSETHYPLKVSRKKATMMHNKNIKAPEHLAKCKKMMTQINKNLKKLQELGIDYQFEPADIPQEIKDTYLKIAVKKGKNKPKKEKVETGKIKKAKQGKSAKEVGGSGKVSLKNLKEKVVNKKGLKLEKVKQGTNGIRKKVVKKGRPLKKK